MNPEILYNQLASSSAALMEHLRKSAARLSWLRLGVFVFTAIAVWVFWTTTIAVFACVLIGAVFFVYFVKQHANVNEKLRFETAFNALCNEELKIRLGQWHDGPDGAQWQNPAHSYTSDLGVFGKYSLYQYINRTQSQRAGGVLSNWLSTPLSEIAAIAKEKATHLYFANDPEWCLRYLAAARLYSPDQTSEAWLERWAATPIPRNGYTGVLFTRVLPALALAALGAFAGGILSANAYLYVFLLPIFITGFQFKKLQAIFSDFGKASANIEGLKTMLQMLRTRNWESASIESEYMAAAVAQSELALTSLAKIDGAVSSRNNLLVGTVLNALLLWDFQCLRRIEQWKLTYGKMLPLWLEFAHLTEAYQSTALYCFNHPELCYPQFNCEGVFEMRAAVHPVLGKNHVPNDLSIHQKDRIQIITGANMAGKSTFLRTVGLNVILALRGLPVACKSMHIEPCIVFTSMLTTDSLGDSESYFYSELKRLRSMVDSLESTGKLHFLILDEILKGTNSTDKAEGSRRFLRKLLAMPCKGIIATHDLSLCDMSLERPEEVHNTHFEVEFDHDELQFDYKLREGVCANMNASFLLTKMGLAGES